MNHKAKRHHLGKLKTTSAHCCVAIYQSHEFQVRYDYYTAKISFNRKYFCFFLNIDIQPPRPRPLGFRAGVHKSESAKEMLLSQNMFGALPPSPPSSSADVTICF